MNRTLTIHGGYRRYDEVSFLKGFSIFTIVLMHLLQNSRFSMLPNWIQSAAALGGTGVHVFFVCSGFGLALSYQKREIGYLQFLKKRFCKVYIPYIIIVVISFLLPTIIIFNGNRIGALLSHVFLYKMFIPEYDESFGFFWFMSTLFQFYFVFVPLYRFRKAKGNKITLLVSLLISISWWVVTWITGLSEVRIWGSFFLQYLWEFSIGIVLADYLIKHEKTEIHNIILFLIAVIGIGLEGIMAKYSETLKVFNDIPALFGYGSLALIIYQIRPFKKIGLYISSFSYEWYLVHYLAFSAIFLIADSQNTQNQLLVATAAFVFSVFLGVLYYKAITITNHLYERR